MPLTTSLVGYMFGPVHLTMLNGFVFLGHQVGSFLGGWGGGKLFDLQGNYDTMWWISIALGVVSALLHWPIVEKPVARPQFARAARMTSGWRPLLAWGAAALLVAVHRRDVRAVGHERPRLHRRPDRGVLPLRAGTSPTA